MHATIGRVPPVPAVLKHRTISLTNRAPIRIVEDDWPIVAHGQFGQATYWEGEEYGHWIQMFLRRRKDWTNEKRQYDISEILHAKYEYRYPVKRTDASDDESLTVRVGRLLAWDTIVQDGRMECQTVNDMWQHIRDVGEELRERIINQHHKRHVTLAVDELFGNLTPDEVK